MTVIEEINNDQMYILYQMEEWHTHRTTQNLFIEYRSWSGIFQTLSMYANYADLDIHKEILFLTPIQIDAVILSRSGLWAEQLEEFVYESYSIEEDFSEIVGSKVNLNNSHRRRDVIRIQHESQQPPKLVIILNGEQLTEKMLEDTNKLFHCQTIVCMDSARYHPTDSLVYHIKHPLKHIFLNENIDELQKFLYTAMEKRLIPLSKEKSVRVVEYTRGKVELSKYPRPIFSMVEEYQDPSPGIVKGSLVYSENYNWRYSLEDDRYYLIKGLFLVVDVVSNRFGVRKITCHPTYSKFKFKVVPDLKLKGVGCPCFVSDTLPLWKFKSGSLIVPKTIKSLEDARRLYNGMNLFESGITLVIV